MIAVAVAGLVRWGTWVPRFALVTGVVGLLGIAAINPDAWIAQQQHRALRADRQARPRLSDEPVGRRVPDAARPPGATARVRRVAVPGPGRRRARLEPRPRTRPGGPGRQGLPGHPRRVSWRISASANPFAPPGAAFLDCSACPAPTPTTTPSRSPRCRPTRSRRCATRRSTAIAAAADLAALKQVRLDHAGDRSPLALANREIGALPPQARKEAGQRVGQARGAVNQALPARQAVLEAEHEERMLVEETVDVTLPTDRAPRGVPAPAHDCCPSYIADVFVAMGWEVAEGPVVEAEWLNFDALNLGPDHPARTMQDTFWTEPAEDHVVLRTHTSPVQARTMLTREPPIYVVCPGRVFRTDEYDATHSPMFHQVEGLVVDEGITMAHLKGTLDHFASADVRRRDHHAVPAVVLPVHRAQRRGRPGLLRLPRASTSDAVPHLPGRGLDRVGRLRRGQPARAHRLRRRPRALHRLRLRHGHRPHADVPPRRGGPARLLRGRRPLLAAPSERRSEPAMRAPVSWIRDVRRPARRRHHRAARRAG